MAPRSTSRSTDAVEAGVVVVGTIRSPHGVRGEVRVQPQTDTPGRFKVGSVLLCDGVGLLRVASLRGLPAEPIVRFDGYDSRPAARALANRELRVTRAEARRAAAKGSYLWADLIGLSAETPDGAVLGTIAEVLRAGAADVLVVRGEREWLLPMIASVVRAVDLPGGRVVVVPQEEA
ncbi:MAG: ribosome maturation factor RimM [Candidatus Limnocylindria bacterium]|nr:ribosome maturation factor RimM [Candidatus Limnocylindria bacterium]